MSRFDEVEPTYTPKKPKLAIYAEGARFNAGAKREFLQDVESLTPVYDAESDELAFLCYEDSTGIRSVFDEDHGAGIALKSVLQARQIGIDVSELREPVHLPLEYDEEEGLSYVELSPLREAIEEQDEVQKTPSNTVEEGSSIDEDSSNGGESLESAVEDVPPIGPAESPLDLTEVDMRRVRQLLPEDCGTMDVVRLCRSSQSVLGVARGLSISRKRTSELLEELGLESMVAIGEADPSGGEV